MKDPILEQKEFEHLHKMKKYALNSSYHQYPNLGGKIIVPLTSDNKKHEFILDISRGSIELKKIKYQTRAKQVYPLARLDLGNQPHRNPDGKKIPSPHIHIYKENYGTKWAYPLDPNIFSNPNDPNITLVDFYKFCNIVKHPLISGRFTI